MKEEKINRFVEKKYSEIAQTDKGCCCSTSSCCESESENRSIKIGYSREDLEKVPKEAIRGLGCGNPLNLVDLEIGENVLDLGSGLGIDVFLASERVGESGLATGIDASEEMVKKAREIAKKNGYENVEFKKGKIEDLPFEDQIFDTVISNCVINLSTDKLKTYKEIYRVLKPGGRIIISDIVTEGKLPKEIKEDPEAWSACIGGAMEKNDYLNTIRDAGFKKFEILSQETFEETESIDAKIMSINVKAKKLKR